jgi:hypothetical protein
MIMAHNKQWPIIKGHEAHAEEADRGTHSKLAFIQAAHTYQACQDLLHSM